MADWRSSMGQTYEYYIVDPNTWKDVKLIDNVKSCTIERDSGAETLGSASIDIDESLGECYVRVYLVISQNGLREKYPLGTFLVQTPASSFDGRVRNVSMDAYTPLLELKDDRPPIGYSIPKGENIMNIVNKLSREHMRAPVVEARSDMKLHYDFIADTSDTWLSFTKDLASNAKHDFALDEMGRVLFSPRQDTASLQPVWTYTDDNSSILMPNLSMEHDIYGIPNVVEVIYSNSSEHYYSRVVNDDPNSPTSTVNRGREIVQRVTDPDLIGDPTENQIHLYAEQLLRDLSSLEYSVTYTHGYCPVNIGDCVRLNYTRAGLVDVKAKVVSQSIKCEPGCLVTETAVFTTKLWR